MWCLILFCILITTVGCGKEERPKGGEQEDPTEIVRVTEPVQEKLEQLQGLWNEPMANWGRNRKEARAKTLEHEMPIDVWEKRAEMERLKRLLNEPMETVINKTLDHELSIDVWEMEKGYYLGFIGFRTDGRIESGYDAGAPLDFIIDSVRYEADRMIFIMRRVIVERDEKTGELRHRNPGLIEVIVTRDEYLATLINEVNGVPKSGMLNEKGTIIQAPIFDKN